MLVTLAVLFPAYSTAQTRVVALGPDTVAALTKFRTSRDDLTRMRLELRTATQSADLVLRGLLVTKTNLNDVVDVLIQRGQELETWLGSHPNHFPTQRDAILNAIQTNHDALLAFKTRINAAESFEDLRLIAHDIAQIRATSGDFGIRLQMLTAYVSRFQTLIVAKAEARADGIHAAIASRADIGQDTTGLTEKFAIARKDIDQAAALITKLKDQLSSSNPADVDLAATKDTIQQALSLIKRGYTLFKEIVEEIKPPTQ